MNAVGFLLRHAVFATRHYAVLCDKRIDVASRQLARLASRGVLVRLTRGVWSQPAHPRFTPFAAVPLLLGNEQGYVSFLSAMHLHGLLAQIPGSVQVATTGHARSLVTPVARYEFLSIQPSMMMEGIDVSTTEPPYNVATAAKALLDALYIATRKGRRFASLPELDMVEVDAGQLRAFLRRQVRSTPIRRAMEARLAALRAYSSPTARAAAPSAKPNTPSRHVRQSKQR